MAYMCPMKGCKEHKGMCMHEKAMVVLLIIIVIFVVFREF